MWDAFLLATKLQSHRLFKGAENCFIASDVKSNDAARFIEMGRIHPATIRSTAQTNSVVITA